MCIGEIRYHTMRGAIEAARDDAYKARDAAWDAARAAARVKLQPTVLRLQDSALSLVRRMLEAK